MTWPTTASKANTDQGTDDPKQALLTDLVGIIDKFNLLQAHVSGFMQTLLSRTTAADARNDLGASGGIWPQSLGGTGVTDGGGLGAVDPSLPPSNNLNSVTGTGWNKTDASTTNKPSTGVVYLVHTIRLASDSFAQLAFRPDTDLDITLSGPFWRASEGGSWIGWKRIAFDEASQAQAEAGTLLGLSMSPLRVAQAIAALAKPIPLSPLDLTNSGADDLTVTTIFSGLSNPHQLEIAIDAGSLDANDTGFIIQLGTSGGFEIAGYGGKANSSAGNATTDESNASGFLLSPNSVQDAGVTWTGTVILRHWGSNVWSYNVNGILSTANHAEQSAGFITLPGTLTQARLTTELGTAHFDGGTLYRRSE